MEKKSLGLWTWNFKAKGIKEIRVRQLSTQYIDKYNLIIRRISLRTDEILNSRKVIRKWKGNFLKNYFRNGN